MIDSLTKQSVDLPDFNALFAEVSNYIYFRQRNEFEILQIARVK